MDSNDIKKVSDLAVLPLAGNFFIGVKLLISPRQKFRTYNKALNLSGQTELECS